MNDKCAGGTGRFMEIVAEALHVPLDEIGPLALQSTKVLPFSSTCAAFGRGSAVAMLKEGERKEDILAGLHESIATRVMALVRKVGIADKFVISGGIGRNVGLVSKIEQKARRVESHPAAGTDDRRGRGGSALRPRPGREEGR